MNRGTFQEAVNKGAAHAWGGRWDKAILEYQRALDLVPEDPHAQTQLAMALFKGGRLREASDLYQALWRAQPDNLSLLRRLVEIQETLGDLDAASESLQLLGEIHRRRGASQDALKAWESALSLRPDNLQLWDSLLELVVQGDLSIQVMPSYLKLARNLALHSRFEVAIQVVERVQVLDPGNPAVLDLLSAIRRGIEFSWHAAASGERGPRQETLGQLIPPVDQSVEPWEQSVGEDQLPISAFAPTPVQSSVPPPVPLWDPSPWVGLSKTASAPSAASAYQQWDQYVPPLVDTTAPSSAEADEDPTEGSEDHLSPEEEVIDTVENEDETAPAGIAIAEQMIELAETSARLGRTQEAMSAYEKALEIAPDLPRARLGIARLQLRARQLDSAESQIRAVVESGDAGARELRQEAVEMMLDLLRERSAYGDLGPAVEGLVWLRSTAPGIGLPAPLVDRISAAPAELLGRPAGDHLDEIVLLPQLVQGEVIQALRSATELLDAGKLRSAADEMYRLIISHPQFLPAQLLLARVLLVQGRVAEARERARRVHDLYEMRGSDTMAQAVMGWMAGSRITGGDTSVRLAELLPGQNGQLKSPPASPPVDMEGIQADDGSLAESSEGLEPDGEQEAPDSPRPLQAPDVTSYWSVVLGHAEASVASGRHDAAAKLLRTALEVDGTIDEPTRAAFLRILELLEPNDEQRCELETLLSKLGLPGELAD